MDSGGPLGHTGLRLEDEAFSMWESQEDPRPARIGALNPKP